MAISNLLSGRVRVVSPKNVTQDRYQFVDLSQVEPNLGVPNFSASLSGSPAIVVSDDQGNRGFVRSLDLDRVSGQFTGSFTGSAESLSGSFTGSYTGSFSGSYFGDGAGLFNLPDTIRLASGSATASISPNFGLQINVDTTIAENLYVSKSIYAEQLVVSIISSSVIYSSGSNKFGDELSDKQEFTGSVTITGSLAVENQIIFGEATGSSISASFTGSFFGDGANLINLPQATKLASGSVTASVSPENGFLVISLESGSIFSGSVKLSSGSVFSGSGRDLFDIPESALSFAPFRISSGSVTASVSPVYGFRVESPDSGSEFTGSIKLSSGSFFSGSGRFLFDIPESALSFAPFRIASGSVTASVSPVYGFRVESAASGSEFTGSVDISGSVNVDGAVTASFFVGDGSKLINVPSLVAPRIASGSATASISPDRGLEINTSAAINGYLVVTGSVSASQYSGSGRGLFDIPRSALSEEVFRIASGSVTASVSPTEGFKVESLESGSQFTGSLFVSGGVELSSGSSFSGSGERLFNIPRTALSPDALISNLIASGSVTASVSDSEGFVVKSTASGSTFSGSIFLSSGSFFSGSGEKLFNIPRSAISNLDTNLIFSGSATASIDPVKGFNVNIYSKFSGSMIVSSSNYAIPSQSLNTVYDVTNNGFSAYLFTNAISASNPTLTLVRGVTYTFNVNALGHPFWIKSGSSKVSGTNDAYNTNVTNNGTDNGTIIFSPDELTPDNLYYICQNHSTMNGDITIVNSIEIPAEITFIGKTNITGSLGVSGSIFLGSGSFFSGSGRGLFDIPQSAFTGDAFRIASGSVTASVSPVYGFKVESLERGSEFTGSIIVSGSITAERIFSADFTGSFEGDGSRLRNVPSIEGTRIVSGSVTASVSPIYGFRLEGGERAEFSSSIFVSGSLGIELASGSSYSGSGARLFNIPRTALAPDALFSEKIVSGSVTASVSPNFGFVVTSIETGSTFYGEVRVITGSSFSGSGRKLFDIPVAALSDLDTSKIFSGSATASISPDKGFLVNTGVTVRDYLIVTGSTDLKSNLVVTGSLVVNQSALFKSGISSSVFSGSGRGLTDIPFSALSQELFRIASGSVTASALPNRGFIVESGLLGSQLTGSVSISGSLFAFGNIELQSGSAFSGSGRNLFDIPESALSFAPNKIASGSVTASVSPLFGFKVQSFDSGSEFTGSVDITGSLLVRGDVTSTSGSYFIGDGRYLSNITLANLAIDSTKIFSGSATASISPNEGFEVNVHSRFDGSFIVSSSARPLPNELIDNIIYVTNDGSSAYVVSNGNVSGSNATLTLVRGVQYTFNVNAVGHPLWIKFVNSFGTSNAVSQSITNNGDDSGNIVFTPYSGSPNTLYYNCQLHSSMAGQLNIVDFLEIPSEITLIGDTQITGSLDVSGPISASMFSGSGRGLFDIPRSALSEEVFRIATGSITASVTPERGFLVESLESGSTFSGSITMASGSFISSSGRLFFDIPRSALTEDALISAEIKSGSVTASVSPVDGFRVLTPFTSSIDESGSFSTQIASQFTGSISVSGSIYNRISIT